MSRRDDTGHMQNEEPPVTSVTSDRPLRPSSVLHHKPIARQDHKGVAKAVKPQSDTFSEARQTAVARSGSVRLHWSISSKTSLGKASTQRQDKYLAPTASEVGMQGRVH